ncbi:cyclin-y [Anaeramoeba flamelloides]|uniref:Cyclin-y n=1 Tax=Anaeramoeba flamelloides TaxID=1746091 RepID=A0AAV7ZJ01_9EUKA|nr:cyclin-y [Anaeramoeba flamelloides]
MSLEKETLSQKTHSDYQEPKMIKFHGSSSLQLSELLKETDRKEKKNEKNKQKKQPQEKEKKIKLKNIRSDLKESLVIHKSSETENSDSWSSDIEFGSGLSASSASDLNSDDSDQPYSTLVKIHSMTISPKLENQSENVNQDPKEVQILTFTNKVKRNEKEKTDLEEPLFLTEGLKKHVHKGNISQKPFQKMNTRHMSYQNLDNVSTEGSITSPKLEFVVKSISYALFDLINEKPENNNEEKLEEYEIFDEDKHRITQKKIQFFQTPDRNYIELYLLTMSRAAQLVPEICIIMLIYIDRIFKYTKKNYGVPLRLTAKNWRRVTLINLLLATKFWEELAVWNSDWKRMFPKMDIEDMNNLESAGLNFLGFNIRVKLSTYTKYYFELRELTVRTKKKFPLEPIQKNAEEKFNKLSTSFRSRLKTKIMKNLRNVRSERIILKKKISHKTDQYK